MSKALPLSIPLKAVAYDKKNAKEMLSRIIKDFDPKSNILEHHGYLCCMSTLLKGSKTIRTKSKYINHQLDTVIFKLYDIIIKPDTHDDGESMLSGEILASEYKIHLMPKPGYIFPVIQILLDACKHDKALAELIFQIKVQIDLNAKDYLDQIMPRIVVYPSLSKEAAEVVLQKICSIFDKYDLKEIAENLIPRFSAQKNLLVSYAQGSGDIKNAFSKEDQELFLTDSQVHYSWGEKLLVPKPPL